MQSPFAHSCAATRRRLLPQRKGPPLKTAAKIGQSPEYYYFMREFVVQIHPAEEESQPACPGNRSGDQILPYQAAGRDAVGEQLSHTPTGMPAEKGWQRRLKAGTRSGRQMRTPPTSLADRRIMAFMSPPAYRQRFPPIRMDQKSLQSDRSCRLNLSYNPYCNSRSSSL